VAVALSLHLVEELLSEVEVSTLVGGVDECVVRKVVGLSLVLLAHCLVDQLALLQLAVEVEHLEDGGVEDGVHADALVVHHPLLGLSSTSEVLVLDACFQQSALGEFVHFDLEFGHLDVEDLETLVQFSFLPLGLDQDTECHLVRLHLRVEHQLLDFHSFIHVVLAYCHVHYAIVEHAVDLQLVRCQFVQPAEYIFVGFLFWNPACLFFHALDQSRLGLLIGLQIATLHLFVKIVCQLKLVQVNAQIHQRVIGLLAGIELLQFHFFDQFQRRVEIL